MKIAEARKTVSNTSKITKAARYWYIKKSTDFKRTRKEMENRRKSLKERWEKLIKKNKKKVRWMICKKGKCC